MHFTEDVNGYEKGNGQANQAQGQKGGKEDRQKEGQGKTQGKEESQEGRQKEKVNAGPKTLFKPTRAFGINSDRPRPCMP